MPDHRMKHAKTGGAAIFREPPEIPAEWIIVLNRLHPITAIVAWHVLTATLTPETIRLAQYSPDRERYTFINMVGSANAAACPEIAELARAELDEVFQTLGPKRQVH